MGNKEGKTNNRHKPLTHISRNIEKFYYKDFYDIEFFCKHFIYFIWFNKNYALKKYSIKIGKTNPRKNVFYWSQILFTPSVFNIQS